jgi:2-isopropylmalate synthase
MGLLAGGDRIEGTLFGNGERTGNVDIVTLALNMYSQGVDPGLDFSNPPEITKVYEKVTRMHVYERQPYSGQLVFAAFSGSHQDAIAKGMKFREERNLAWTVPYLPIDPTDIGRVYEADVIRINSQSGKGGIGYILETQFKLVLPPKMREQFGYHIKSISDHAHKELSPKEVYDIFHRDFVNLTEKLNVLEAGYDDVSAERVRGKIVIEYNGKATTVEVEGNGRLDCVSSAIKQVIGKEYVLESYVEHALEEKSTSQAASYICIVCDGKPYWGAGIHNDIMTSSVKALVSAINRLL